MLALSSRDIALALKDIRDGVGAWNIWHVLALQELRQRYRRSMLGPLWLAVSMAVQVTVIGSLLGTLFKQDFGRYLPYATLGLMLWGFLSSSLNEGAGGFISADKYILQAKRPLSAFIMHVMWRNLIYLAHTSVVYVVVAIIFGVPVTLHILLLPLGLLLMTINLGWMLLLLAALAARFRDVQMILQNLMSVMFWVTPIMYYPEMLPFGRFNWLVHVNPLTHILNVVREPILGHLPSALSWGFLIATGFVGWIVTFLFFARFRARIPYWL